MKIVQLVPAMDQGGVSEEIMTIIKEKAVKLCPELPVDNVIFNATHTHTAMPLNKTVSVTDDGVELYPWEKCREHATNKAAEAIVSKGLDKAMNLYNVKK